MNYHDHEKTALQGLSGSQGERINARLQAALNHAMSSELEMGEYLNTGELLDGVVNGVIGMLVQVKLNYKGEGKALADHMATMILRHWKERGGAAGKNAVYTGEAIINPHRGRA